MRQRLCSSAQGAAEARGPPRWREQWRLIERARRRRTAPVDVMGCDRLGNRLAPARQFRLETLVSGILSAQTKDGANAAAVGRLQAACRADGRGGQGVPGAGGALTPEWLLATPQPALEALLHGVSFHARKAGYLRGAAAAVAERHGGDVPATAKELMALPGVGPKVAFLVLSAAWGKHEGVCVDTHVHRISNRLGWTAPPHAQGRGQPAGAGAAGVVGAGVGAKTKSAEATRKALEVWLPRELWWEANTLLVGFGQEVCSAVRPKCEVCPLADEGLCPEAPRR